MANIFLDRLKKSSEKNNSKIILALDLSIELKQNNRNSWNIKKRLLAKEVNNLIEKVGDKIAAVKINRQLILSLGLYDYLPTVIDQITNFNLPLIADCKINDVGHTNEWITRHYLNAGFHAVIANPFVGWEMGLDRVFKVASEFSAGVILLVYMSHPGASQGYGQIIVDPISGEQIPQYIAFAKKANDWNAHGVVVGATVPSKISEVSKVLNKDIPILSPGIGVQGGELEKVFTAGASYVIIGRTIFNSDNPSELVFNLNKKIKSITQVG
ncbi:MAG: orotidine 5'-phosphate decarboxylase / HUMPS family protein [Candidatus Odinarchaeia archaeon]